MQPFLSHKYVSLKRVLIERRGLTTPERANKVISGERLGSDISSRFLRHLQKTADSETTAVVGKTVIHQAFMRQIPASIRAHLATTPDSRPTSLESLAILADRAVASELDVKDSSVGVTEARVNDNKRPIEIIEDISKHLKKLENPATQKKNNSTTNSKPTIEVTERPISRHFYQTQMRGLLHLASLNPVITMTIMGRMFFPQINQPLVRPLRRRIYRKTVPHSQRPWTIY